MVANRSRDTRPELALRRRLHALGLRYRVAARLDLAELRVRPDVVFPRARVAVFVDGCFWHGCPEHCRPARVNAGFWQTKMSTNAERDRRVNTALAADGWTVIRVWEHEDPDQAAARVHAVVSARSASG